jgi:hypothetical protein
VDVQPLLDAISSGSVLRRSECIVAAWLIRTAEWSEGQRSTIREALCVFVERAVRARRPREYVVRFSGRAVFLMLAIVVIPIVGFTTVAPPIALLLMPLAVLALYKWFDRVDTDRLRQARLGLESVGRIGHPDDIACIATAYADAELREVAASALARVAPALQPGRYGVLRSQSVAALCHALDLANTHITGTLDPQTPLMILQALGVIGDGRAIKAVERAAKEPSSPEVGEAAANLLPLLKQRADESQATGQLLRASSASAADGKKVLLRAASGRADATAPGVLVRASERPGDAP